MITQQVSTNSVIPYSKNPRKNKDAIKKVASSIREFGFKQPIVVDKDMVIVAGHTRLYAAKKLNLDKVPIVVADDLTDAQIKAYRIADNRVSQESEWDYELLKLEFNDLVELDFNLLDTGFDQEELDKLLDIENEGLTDEDAVPDTPEEPITKLGDIYILGNHKLMCGDSTSIDAVDKLMDGAKADMVFTDPPYNINYGNIKHPKFKVRQIENDNMSRGDFGDFCTAFVSCIKLSCNGCVYVFGPPGPDGRIMFTALDDALHCSTTIVWNKDQFTLGRGKYQNKYEPCWFGWNDSGAAFIDDRKLTNVWDFPRPKKSDLHPTMKPVVLVENAIGHASNVGGVIMDLFGGSGSTLIACEKTNRKARLMELDPKYCDVIVKRWEDYTGKKAELEKKEAA
tara:strand:- start:806 stop:1996 length:1191 start_codon:yes stop_codon:yes gene_type:complete